MRLSVTNLVSWIGACERQWLWSQTWLPRKGYSPMWLGSGIHESLAMYYRTAEIDQARASYAAWLARSAHTLESKVSPEYWSELSEVFWNQGDLGRGMLDHYFEFDRGNPLPGQVKDVEKFLSADLPTKDTIRGRLDLILEDDSGRLVVVDHKTYSSYMYPDLLDLDQQLTAYAWLVFKVYGQIPRLVLNILFKKVPAPPTILKSGSLSRAKDQPTTFDLYLKEIEERGFNLSDYQDMLDLFSSPSHIDTYFKRVETTRTFWEIQAFEERASASLARAGLVLEGREDTALALPSFVQCRQCPYLLPCLAFERGEDWAWILETEFSRESLL